MNISIYSPKNAPLDSNQLKVIAEFLRIHLGKFGDTTSAILKALNYAMDGNKGGFIITATDNSELKGVVVLNATGMDEYIPGHILVYIAVHESERGKGLGKTLMKTAMNQATGGIALHVEPDNPAKRLYERLGFTNKYLEMRYQPEEK